MPEGSFGDIKQRDWIRAFRKLGFPVDESKGKGNHVLAKNPTTNQKYTIQRNLHRIANIKIFNQLKKWGRLEREIWDAIT